MKRAILALLGALALLPSAGHAGPWPAGTQRWYAQVGFALLETDRLATPGGSEVSIPDFERRELSLYAEYGLSSRWTVVLRAPLLVESSIDGFGSAYGPGDLALGVQRQLLAGGSTRLALRASLQAPTGDEALGRGLLPTGSGVWEGELVLSLGRTLSGGRLWFFVEGGHLARGGGFADAIVHRAQLGVHTGRRSWLAWNVSGVEPYSRRDAGTGAAAGVGDGVRYLAHGPQVSVALAPGWSLLAGIEDTARERNRATGPTARLALALSR